MLIRSDNISNDAVDFSPYHVKKVKIVEAANPFFVRRYYYKTDPYLQKFIFTTEITEHPTDYLDAIANKGYTFVLDYDLDSVVPYNFYVQAENTPIVFPEDLEIDFSRNAEEDIPNYFENAMVDVECEPKWETPTTGTIKIEITGTGVDEYCTVRLMKDFTSPFIYWFEGDDMEEAISSGNLSGHLQEGTGEDIYVHLLMDDSVLYIRGDLSKLYGLKISTNGAFSLTGLKECKALELLDVLYPIPTQDSAMMIQYRTIDFVPENVKYLYLDYASVTNDCYTKQLEVGYIVGYSKCFTDIVNLMNDNLHYLFYPAYKDYDIELGTIYGEVRISPQKWCANDLRYLNIIGAITKSDLENFQKSVEYLEPQELIYDGNHYNRLIQLYPSLDSTDEAYKYVQSEEYTTWEDNIVNRFPDFVIGEY